MSPLAAYIQELRESRSLNKSELARRLGMAFTTVNAWERKGAVPTRQALHALASKLNLSKSEQQRLLELAMAAQEPAQQEVVPEPPRPPEVRRRLELLITRAIRPERHTFADAAALFAALSEAAPLIEELGANEDAAQNWLDAAAFLRARGEPVTGARLAVVVVLHPDATGEIIRAGVEKKIRTSL